MRLNLTLSGACGGTAPHRIAGAFFRTAAASYNRPLDSHWDTPALSGMDPNGAAALRQATAVWGTRSRQEPAALVAAVEANATRQRGAAIC